MPLRLKRWILFWTPVVWLALVLVKYPKHLGLSSGIVAILKGFFGPTIGAFPPWSLFLAAAIVLAWGIVLFARHPASRRFPGAVLMTGVALAAWGLVAGGFGLSSRAGDWCWLCQTVVVLMGAGCVWLWGESNPERAALMVRSIRQNWKYYRSSRQAMLGLTIIVMFVSIALLAPFLADHGRLDATARYGHQPFESPQLDYYHWLGTDQLGLSVLAQFIWSARVSMAVGIAATLISSLLGAAIGVAAGYYTGWIGEICMRVTDFFLVIPWLPLAMVLATILGQNYVVIIVIIGVTSWPGTARVVRADALRVREQPFIERSKAIGATGLHTMSRHILPNVFPLLFANTILMVAEAVTAETELSFLGLGDPQNFSWGTMLHYAWASGAAGLPAWWYILPPGIAVVLVVLAFSFMGTAFDEILDPKLRSREDSSGGIDEPWHTADVAVPLGGGYALASGAPTLPYGMEHEEEERERDRR